MMVERQPQYARIGGVLRDGAEHGVGFRVVDLAPCPDFRDALRVARPVERQGDRPRTVAHHAVDGERALRRAHAGGDHQRLAAIEIGQDGGRQRDVLFREAGSDVGNGGVFQLVEQRVHLLAHLAGGADMGEGAASQFRRAAHQVGVGRGADADHEDARAAAPRRDGVEQLPLVADFAVGEEDDLAQAPVARMAVVQRRLQGGQHFRAAGGLQPGDILARGGDVRRIGRDAVVEQFRQRVVEADDVETVAGLEMRQGIIEAGAGLLDGSAAHGAGIVDHEHDLAVLLLRGGHGGRRDIGEHIVVPADVLAEQADIGRIAGGGLPFEHEVPVCPHIVGARIAVERDAAGGVVRRVDLHLVIEAFDLAERKARLEIDRDRHRVDAGRIRGLQRRMDGIVGVAGVGLVLRFAPAAVEIGALLDGRGV